MIVVHTWLPAVGLVVLKMTLDVANDNGLAPR